MATAKKAVKKAVKKTKKVKPEQMLETPVWSGRERFQSMKAKKIGR